MYGTVDYSIPRRRGRGNNAFREDDSLDRGMIRGGKRFTPFFGEGLLNEGGRVHDGASTLEQECRIH